MMRARRPNVTSARAGFTLVELMVALVAGSFVVMGAFYMSDVSSRMFSEQLRRSESMMNVRAATELIRRDIGRAGFLSVRSTFELLGGNIAAGLGATGPGDTDVAPQIVTAVRVMPDGRGGQMLILTGNMSTSEQYFVASSNGTSLLLQMTNESFRRSFINPATGAFLQARFMEAFFPLPAAPGAGRMVSVTELSIGRIYLRNLSGATLGVDPPTLNLSTPLPMNALGSSAFMNVQSIAVAPVSTVRYAMEVPDASLSRVGGQSYLTGGRLDNRLHPVLVRRELNPANLTPIAGTERVVLDSVVDLPQAFQVEVIYNSLAPAGMNLVHEASPHTMLTDVQQGQIHSLIIQLVLETEQQQGDALDQARALRARRGVRFEVMLPNAARNSGALN